MRAAVWNDQGTVDVVTLSKPRPRPGWVRLKVGACGICGSDLHGYKNPTMQWSGARPGHEITAFVDALGEGVQMDIGQMMAVEPIDSCGACPTCYDGHYNLCSQVKLLGFGHAGGLAEYVEAPANRLHALPQAMDMAVATMAEPLAGCVRAIRLAGVGLGKQVAVLGAGTIGLLTVAAARMGGAANIHVTARHPRQAELARTLGANETYQDIESMLAAVGDRAFDIIIETVGGWGDTLVEAVRVAAPGATIVNVGCFEGNTPIPGPMFFEKELTLRASNCYAFDQGYSDFALAVALLPSLATQVEPMITHKFALDDIVPAFDTALDKSTGSIKVQIHLAP